MSSASVITLVQHLDEAQGACNSAGADQVVPKPFVPGHLSGAVRAALRTRDPDSILQMATSIRVGDVLFDAERREVRWDDGFRVRFSAREWELLAVLLGHANRYFSAEELRDAAWRDASLGRTRSAATCTGCAASSRAGAAVPPGHQPRPRLLPAPRSGAAPRGGVGSRTRGARVDRAGAADSHTLASDADRSRSGARSLRRSLDAAQRGRADALLLHGEPGIGKTALLDDTATHAEKRGFGFLRARGLESESGLPYAGLSELLAPILVHRDALPAVQEHALAGALALEGGEPPTASPWRRPCSGSSTRPPMRARCSC